MTIPNSTNYTAAQLQAKSKDELEGIVRSKGSTPASSKPKLIAQIEKAQGWERRENARQSALDRIKV